jgi:hypothetical protein
MIRPIVWDQIGRLSLAATASRTQQEEYCDLSGRVIYGIETHVHRSQRMIVIIPENNDLLYKRFEVLSALKMSMLVFWVVTLYGFVGKYIHTYIFITFHGSIS